MAEYLYDMRGAFEAGETDHPRAVFRRLCESDGVEIGPEAPYCFGPADCWIFFTTGTLKVHPAFISRSDTDDGVRKYASLVGERVAMYAARLAVSREYSVEDMTRELKERFTNDALRSIEIKKVMKL